MAESRRPGYLAGEQGEWSTAACPPPRPASEHAPTCLNLCPYSVVRTITTAGTIHPGSSGAASTSASASTAVSAAPAATSAAFNWFWGRTAGDRTPRKISTFEKVYWGLGLAGFGLYGWSKHKERQRKEAQAVRLRSSRARQRRRRRRRLLFEAGRGGGEGEELGRSWAADAVSVHCPWRTGRQAADAI